MYLFKKNGFKFGSTIHLFRYRCSITNCQFSCIHQSSFIEHLTDAHSGIDSYRCFQCPSEIPCSSGHFNELLNHLNTHAIGLFQCTLCQWASQLSCDIFVHMCCSHSSYDHSVLMRRAPCSDQERPTETLAQFWSPNLHQTSSNSLVHKINFTRPRFIRLTFLFTRF